MFPVAEVDHVIRQHTFTVVGKCGIYLPLDFAARNGDNIPRQRPFAAHKAANDVLLNDSTIDRNAIPRCRTRRITFFNCAAIDRVLDRSAVDRNRIFRHIARRFGFVDDTALDLAVNRPSIDNNLILVNVPACLCLFGISAVDMRCRTTVDRDRISLCAPRLAIDKSTRHPHTNLARTKYELVVVCVAAVLCSTAIPQQDFGVHDRQCISFRISRTERSTAIDSVVLIIIVPDGERIPRRICTVCSNAARRMHRRPVPSRQKMPVF